MKKILFVVSFCFLPSAFCLLFAQQLSLSNQYVINKSFLSPAYSGASGGLEVFGSYRKEWADVAGAPETKTISANGTICKNMGIGGSISSQQAGIFQDLSATVNYAYHLKIATAHQLSFGLGFGLLESRVNLAGNAAQSDPVALNNQDVNDLVLDANFGALYRFKKLYAGVTIPRMISSKIKSDQDTIIYSLAPHYRNYVGYTYSINKEWGVDPVAVVSFAENSPLFYEVAVAVKFQQRIWLSPIYKKSEIAIGIGGIPYDNFIVNYSYEFASKGIMGEAGGSHEISIGWRMMQKKKDEPNPSPKKPYYEWLNK